MVMGFHYTLKDKDGNVIDSSDGKDPLYVMLGRGHIVKGLDDLLPSLEVGDKRTVEVQPDQGYGQINEELRMKVPRDNFPPGTELKLRDQFQTSQEPGAPVFTVMHIDDEGMATQHTQLIKNGKLTNFLVDRVGSEKTGYPRSGSGRRQSYRYAPASRMRNTFIEAGDSHMVKRLNAVSV